MFCSVRMGVLYVLFSENGCVVCSVHEKNIVIKHVLIHGVIKSFWVIFTYID